MYVAYSTHVLSKCLGISKRFLPPLMLKLVISNCLLAYNTSGKLNLFLTTPVGLRILSAELPLLRNHDPRTKWAFVHGEYYNQNLQTPFFVLLQKEVDMSLSLIL